MCIQDGNGGNSDYDIDFNNHDDDDGDLNDDNGDGNGDGDDGGNGDLLMMTCVRVDLEFGVGRMGFQGIGHPTKLPWKHPMNSAARFVCQNFKMLKDLSTTFP